MYKGRPHGHRYGKTTAQRDYLVAHNLRKRCIKRHFQGIHHRFVKDPEFRASQLKHDRTEEVCIQMKELTQKDVSYHMTQAEYFRYRKNWWISLNNSGRSGPLKDRSDFNDALTTKKTVYTNKLENDNSGQCHSGSINTGTNHRVLPPVGGNGAIPGGAHNNSKKVRTNEHTCKAT